MLPAAVGAVVVMRVVGAEVEAEVAEVVATPAVVGVAVVAARVRISRVDGGE
jgi:hypothetical protein